MMKSPVGWIGRLWRHFSPFIGRFGLIDGLQIGSKIANVKWRQAARTPVLVPVPGWSSGVELRAGSSDWEVFAQLLINRELEFSLLPPPQRIIDGGANIGLATRIFAERWPDAHIVGIELERGNIEVARRNCAGLEHVDLRHAALWGSSGRVNIVDENADAHSYRATEGEGTASVRAYRIGELLDELGWERVDLVKLDIEGAELSVLRDAAAWLPRVQHLLVELHDRLEPGCTAAFDAAVAGGDWVVQPQGEYLLASRRSG